jgi:hypothetical protein
MSTGEVATSAQRPRPQWSTSAILWICVLGIMASFQTWRGAYVDGVLFYAIVAMLITDRLTGGRIRILKQPIVAPKVVTLAITGTLALVLVVAPRHGWIDLVTMVAIGVTVLLLAWEPAPARPERSKSALARSALSWSVLGVALCVWEALAFIFSVTMPNGNDNFPTISVLLDPVVSNLWGRLFFVALWLAGGLALLRFWSKR